ncbi:MAG: diacylglycerol kinase family protein [Bacteroidales bacterium]|nr:diacylglycerol kinase family lipid kinase [Bacteroidales bacterium]MDD2264172.1 diacylglycerol kinase family lipid kinase [Bacteroidales bacterium]MDD2831357.1 diacylglycerol kinase family lipid kinase [Bacteroidales bacterium]MDD3208351.1 diacylglycerol kinase family lipid kinase [Bacteroidales bacterium]MDD3696966.1 diacylglycerol kinase family lipid kinase [Bacteroidales bacterium]
MFSSRWMIILNPVAGGGKTAVMWPHISKFLHEHDLCFECIFTKHKYHAVTITIEAIREGFRNFIVIGGDGTFHEVINGIFYQQDVPTQNITMGIIPIGTGNDFIYAYKIPLNHVRAMETIIKNKSILTDVGWVSFQDYGIERSRYFANAAGMGLDAAVIKHYERIVEQDNRRGKAQYLSSLLHQFLFYRPKDLRILVNGNMFYEGPVLTCSIGIGVSIGSGMKALPLSIPDDGLFDITLVAPMNKVTLALRIRDFIDGKVYSFKEALHGRGKTVEIMPNSKNTTFLETDGELMGTPPYVFSIIPSSLRLLVGEDFVPYVKNETSPEF